MKTTAGGPVDSRNNWGLFWWIIGTLAIPVTIPYMVIQLLSKRRSKCSLPGKVVVITGASSGLGESLAHVFYLAGCKVVLAARRRDELERVRRDLMETHSTVPTHPPVVVTLDLADLNSIPERVQQILDIYQSIDILINNGGISVRAEVMKTSIDVDLKVMLINYLGAVALTKAVLPSMVQRKSGHIVCVSSIQGKIAIPQRSAYTASKHALQAFCDSLRAEIASQNVHVTVISPGYINTALSMNALTGNGTRYGQMDATTETGAQPDAVARQILSAVETRSKDVIIAGFAPRIAHYLRVLCPSAYFWIMARRATKLAASR